MNKDKSHKSKFAFTKTNYILFLIGLVIICIGFALMAGPSTTATHFEPDIFSVRRIKVAPVTSFIGFIFVIFAILYKKKD